MINANQAPFVSLAIGNTIGFIFPCWIYGLPPRAWLVNAAFLVADAAAIYLYKS